MNQMPADFGSGKQIDLFSYAALSRADEAAAREDAALIKAHMKSAAESIIAVGLALKRQKERLPHGMFLPWIEAEFEMHEQTARRFMQVADNYASKSNIVLGLNATALYELAAPSTPQPIRDEVEALLVDGQKVTTADIRKMKAEAKAKQASIEDLAARNTELSQRVVEPVQQTVDEDAIREEGRRDAERALNERIHALSNESVSSKELIKSLRAEIDALRASPQPTIPDPSNVVRPAFGQPDDPDDFTDEGKVISAFAGAVGSMEGLEFSPASFWEKQGKRGTHGKRLHQALLSVNAIIGLLIKEYAK